MDENKVSESKYSIEFLVQKFQTHSKESEKIREEQVENFKENNPGIDLPEWLKDDFNFPLALNCICLEILELKNKKSHCLD